MYGSEKWPGHFSRNGLFVKSGMVDVGQTGGRLIDMQTITCSQARDDLNAMMDKAAAACAPVVITRRRGENVMPISASEWAGMMRTWVRPHRLRSLMAAPRLNRRRSPINPKRWRR